ncbi:zinc-finger domain-containing protein [Candidatus Hepatobacter penaei]|uniref:zinc-finger domain-containing protein n=1 Tax=Candidatus Hepatobacter penaei TaxID=1274402 RepID=UPI0004F29ED8|nr:zinc-finger domain-containing protein [Candidatus Hepatobacter penaei]
MIKSSQGRHERHGESITISMPIARCQGEGSHGHPVVFLNLQPSGRVVCPYCSQVFESPQHYQEGV